MNTLLTSLGAGRRSPRSDKLRRTVPDHRRTRACRCVRQPLVCSSLHFHNANLIANTELDIAPPRTTWGRTGDQEQRAVAGPIAKRERDGPHPRDDCTSEVGLHLPQRQSGGSEGRRSAPRSWRSSNWDEIRGPDVAPARSLRARVPERLLAATVTRSASTFARIHRRGF